ncbi:MAG: undecaprenyldiphospho-muramoylpentapeptide beta-N-acetylglucosaminyltransferase [Rhodospirillaceae bacterium]|jgi:UDP-N-acetylglucosamine--N-acetylmuramyl-(pentapeptide) pyrophosphoryl-undecaprenol N-acetylglucosamine transferase|nr:undecaprenyldiphospho-muramoylpentapeptide beta-N-acetylglucosaminyltransferase [Rhodospirillaceae bacterium]
MSDLFLLTAGGTGGHIFPAQALAVELLNRNLKLALITDRRGMTYCGTLSDLTRYKISASGISGRGFFARLSAIGALGIGFLQMQLLLRTLSPAVVIGFGGYSSVPAMLVASFYGIPTLLHEQNAVLGRANRLLASRATCIATSFDKVNNIKIDYQKKVVQTGMPVRREIISLRNKDYPILTKEGSIHILVLGGSQGSAIMSEVVPSAIELLPNKLRNRIIISQQSRPENLEYVRSIYRKISVQATVESFFYDIPERLVNAHLVIARSGASTVAELTILGRPSILIPYPYAIDDHQTINAYSIDKHAGGWLIPQESFNAINLKSRLLTLFTSQDILIKAASSARSIGAPYASARLADLAQNIKSENTS